MQPTIKYFRICRTHKMYLQKKSCRSAGKKKKTKKKKGIKVANFQAACKKVAIQEGNSKHTNKSYQS